LQHGDVGGYTSTVRPLPKIVRSRELLARWGELMAFSVVLRTHEGNRPALNVQVYSDETTLADFARAARLHAAWRGLRTTLMAEAAATGMPVVRHPWLAYPDDAVCAGLHTQFFLGPDLLVAPVVHERAERVTAYLPSVSGAWTHVFTGAVHEAGRGNRVSVAAPLGEPGLFVRAGSPDAAGLIDRLRTAARGGR
jgi:alpha-glucosidase